MARSRLDGAVVKLLAIVAFAAVAFAHEHDESEIPEGEAVSAEPLDTILWVHIMIQILAWGIIFPTGMVLGITKNRWHVPVQILGTVLAIVGYFLGHAHKGRQFSKNVHAQFAPWLNILLAVQVGLGIYLKLHLERTKWLKFTSHFRRYFVFAHGVVGKAMPVLAWVQMLFGGITALGFCRQEGDHMGQCLAHFIMGSAFIAYGILLTILLLVGQAWLVSTGRSQEFFDSAIIAAWGCVNTFTEHRWGQNWGGNDIQHTTMGVIWWCAGLAGVWLSKGRGGRPKRNFVPGFVILITGWAMSAHEQHLMLSTMVHTIFGYTLMAAGLTRIIEVAFVLRDRNAVEVDDTGVSEPNSWQYLPPFLLYASGFLFMGATEEQMALISGAHITHVSYVLVLYSFAFLLFLFVNILLHLYSVLSPPPALIATTQNGQPKDLENQRAPRIRVNGSPWAPGHRPTDSRQIRDAEEFELEGLMSDEEEGGTTRPTTAGTSGAAEVDVGVGVVRRI